MPQAIAIADAGAPLRSREDLLDAGHTEREIRALVAAGRLIRVRRGWYTDAATWHDLWSEGRHLLRVLAVHRAADAPGPVFHGVSAAVLLGLPLYRLAPKNVHVLILGARHGRTVSDVVRHHLTIEESDIVEVDGIRCTSVERTVLDLACALTPEAALAAADAALRACAVRGHEQDPDVAASWRERMGGRAAGTRVRGIRQARRILAFADGRAQLPGESVSRLQLHRLGFTGIELQTPVTGPAGEEYRMDFAFPRSRSFGEFDGAAKYLDPEMRAGRTVERVVLDEKRREDAVRGVTGWRVVRWGWDDILTADRLGDRLRAFGIRPPG